LQSRRASDANNLWYLEADFTKQDIEWGGVGDFHLKMIREDLDPFDEFLN
jgi:hypothetical protein